MNAPLPRPIITDQDGTTLIGVKKRGATVFDRSRFHAAIDETMADIDVKAAEWRRLQHAKTTTQMRREARRDRLIGVLLLLLSSAVSIWTVCVLVRWAGQLL